MTRTKTAKAKQLVRSARAGEQKGPISDFLTPLVGGVLNTVESAVTGAILGKGGRGRRMRSKATRSRRNLDAPIARSAQNRSIQANSSRVGGEEQIAQVDIPAGTPAGTIFFQVLVAAPELGTRIQQLSNLWSRTRFEGATLEILAANASTTGGSYVVGYDQNPTTTYISGSDIPSRIKALPEARTVNAWEHTTSQGRLSRQLNYNSFDSANVDDAEIRQYADGQFVVATATNYATAATYTINVRWHVSFESPNVAPTAGQAFTVTMSGKAIDVISSTSFTADSSVVWSPSIPPDATYTLIEGTLIMVSLNSPGSASVGSITVLGALTTFHTPTRGFTVVGTDEILGQVPTVFFLPNPTRGLRTEGLALISGLIGERKVVKGTHGLWERLVKDRSEKQRTKALIQQEIDERLRESLADLSMADLELRKSQMNSVLDLTSTIDREALLQAARAV